MQKKKEIASISVLGDVVSSRQAADRAALHASLRAALQATNERFGSSLRITVGDEYQGHFPSLGTALTGTWWLRLQLLPTIGVRHGIGVGATSVLSSEDGIEDGPGWWAARAAIEEVEVAATRARTRWARDRVLADAETGQQMLVAAVNAALLGRDEITGRLDARSVSVLRGLLAGRTQTDVARSEGITASAVSQRIRQDGLGALLEMNAQWEALA